MLADSSLPLSPPAPRGPCRELLWVSMYDEVGDDERRRVIEEMCPAPSYVSLLRGIDVALWMAAAP